MGKNRGRKPRMKRGCVETLDCLDRLRLKALENNLTVAVSEVRCRGRVRTLHVMFNELDDGKRRLDWWPGNGLVYQHSTGRKGKVNGWGEALDIARGVRSIAVEDAIRAEEFYRHPDRNAKPVYHHDLREGRPEPVDKHGLPCERCEVETAADELVFKDGAWQCKGCLRRDSLLLAKSRRMADTKAECEPF